MKTDDGFFTRVYEITRLIPNGRVSTYGAIASHIGAPGAARMVGWALNNSQNQNEYVPAHRVVNRKGLISGKQHFHGVNLMQELLESEGAIIEDDRIINFKDIFWDPNMELR